MREKHFARNKDKSASISQKRLCNLNCSYLQMQLHKDLGGSVALGKTGVDLTFQGSSRKHDLERKRAVVMDYYDFCTVTFISSERFQNVCWDLAVNLVNKGVPRENNVWKREDVFTPGISQLFSVLLFRILCQDFLFSLTNSGRSKRIQTRMLLIMHLPSLGKAKSQKKHSASSQLVYKAVGEGMRLAHGEF